MLNHYDSGSLFTQLYSSAAEGRNSTTSFYQVRGVKDARDYLPNTKPGYFASAALPTTAMNSFISESSTVLDPRRRERTSPLKKYEIGNCYDC